jgi:selenocysteine lyase/cysteine desulfurase
MEDESAALARWRADTPGCATRVHLNNAGAALMPASVKDAITAHLGRESLEGGYEASDAAAAAIAGTYADLGRLVGAGAHEIAIVPSATHAFSQALSAFDFAPGDAILTSSDDYISNQLMYLSLAQRHGVRVVRAPDAPEGGVDVQAFAEALRRERPRLAALTWVPTNSGLVQPAAQVGALCRAAGVPYLLDACQAVGQLPVDVETLGCDYLSTTARKFLRGPRGIGFLVVRERALARGDFPLLVDMRGARWTSEDAFALVEDARRFEAWEFPYALVLGLGAAARYAIEVGVARGGKRAATLAALVRERFGAIPGVRSLDHARKLCAIATFAVEGRVGRDLVLALRDRGINTSAQSRGDAVIDLTRKGVDSLIRVSPHYYNTEDEVETAARALAAIVSPSARAPSASPSTS